MKGSGDAAERRRQLCGRDIIVTVVRGNDKIKFSEGKFRRVRLHEGDGKPSFPRKAHSFGEHGRGEIGARHPIAARRKRTAERAATAADFQPLFPRAERTQPGKKILRPLFIAAVVVESFKPFGKMIVCLRHAFPHQRLLSILGGLGAFFFFFLPSSSSRSARSRSSNWRLYSTYRSSLLCSSS